MSLVVIIVVMLAVVVVVEIILAVHPLGLPLAIDNRLAATITTTTI